MEKKLRSPEERLNFADAFIKVDQKPIDLDFWQESFIQDTSKYSITLKSRRTGFSFAVGLKGLIKAMDPARFKYTRQFVSYNEEDAKEKIRYVEEFYDSIPRKHKKKIVSRTKTAMEFYDTGKKTTSRLISIACRPPRGRGGDIVFDEMAIYPANKAHVIYTAGLPVISRGGCIEIGSTPLGKIGAFYSIFSERKQYKEYTRYTIPWWFANKLCTDVEQAAKLAPEMDTEERIKQFGSPDMKMQLRSMILEDFQQEYECTFIDSAMSFITLDLIYANTPGMREEDRPAELKEGEGESLEHDNDGIEIKVFRDAESLILGYSLEKHGRLYIGYDVARHRDASVIFVLGHLPDGKKISVAEIEMKNKDYDYQKDQFRKIMKGGPPIVRAAIDRTGLGDNLCEDMQKEFGHTKVEGVLFNPESKELLAIGVRTGLERLDFLLHNDSRFQRQIHSIKRMPTTGGHFRYDSERDDDGHADSFWAWALANYAMPNQAAVKGFYEQYRESREKKLVGAAKQRTDESAEAGRQRGKSLNRVLREMGMRG
jgi:phage FluMu gp28-like protein